MGGHIPGIYGYFSFSKQRCYWKKYNEISLILQNSLCMFGCIFNSAQYDTSSTFNPIVRLVLQTVLSQRLNERQDNKSSNSLKIYKKDA